MHTSNANRSKSCHTVCLLLNIFHATSPFLYPLKAEKLCFSDVFRGCRKRLVAWNGFIISPITLGHYTLKTGPAGMYLFKVNSRNNRKACEICSKLTIKTPEPCQWRCFGLFIVNFEHISHLFIVYLFLTLNK